MKIKQFVIQIVQNLSRNLSFLSRWQTPPAPPEQLQLRLDLTRHTECL